MGSRQSRTLPRSFGRRKQNNSAEGSSRNVRARAKSASAAVQSTVVPDAVFGASLARLRHSSDPIFSRTPASSSSSGTQVAGVVGAFVADEVPEVLIALVRYLCEHGRYETPFIFRKDGAGDVCRALQQLIVQKTEDGQSILASDFDEIEGVDALVVATVLKRFVRQLQEPLLTYPVCETLLRLQHGTGQTQGFEAWVQELRRVPPREMASLLFLFRFLVKVLRSEAQNLMNMDSIATIFALALIRKRDESEVDAARDMQARMSILKQLLTEMQKSWQQPQQEQSVSEEECGQCVEDDTEPGTISRSKVFRRGLTEPAVA